MGVSLKDIAKRAGVSVATVSNVVNGYRPVAEATRERVRQAIDELGYSPNLSARHLRNGRTGIIALAIPELNNPYFAELADAAIREAGLHGYTVLLDYTDGDREKELLVSQGFRAQVIDGLILSPVQLRRADVLSRTSETPMVLVGEGVYNVPYDHIAIDNVAASVAAMTHLLGLGRRRIAFVGAQSDVNRQPAQLRLLGYQEALSGAGLSYDPGLVVTTDYFGRSDGAAGLRRLMALPEPPDAVFAYNDLIAIGVLRAAVELGLRVPDDIAVVGFDDIDEGRYSNPTLTTISPDKADIGRRAVAALIGRLDGSREAEPEEVQVPFELVTRESTLGHPEPG
ncbi:LacI family DNA-binding transcriptional regulator [Planosporangium mesophilum]|uniref:LacI family transcriptional regulator n=1 Tax=Planosporangium mesophilum TaxID=689768 RepID=A0A8J3TC49_9ACTN|nr:LacI family DNA-binding transcriptional regulator [Planosporangium mesophilum]NJC84927.1 LacI family transcriptional regulator [Planosporangium mesophilum]GII23604.1 LacI family transcriptional regulator [Planosporangium mesophilum]